MTDEQQLDQRLEAALGSIGPEDLAPLPAPPQDLWSSIEAATREEPSQDDPIPIRARRGPRPPVLIGIAAAVVAVLVAGAVFALGSSGSDADVAARASLSDAPLDATTGSTGDAVLVDDDGELVLKLDLVDLPPATKDSVFEVWLIDPATQRLQALGLTDGSGRYVVPAGVDAATYSVVDVSREPVDGDATHSGDSIVRGTLEPVT